MAVVIISRFKMTKDKPYIEILSPRAGEVWIEGEIREVCWNSFGVEKVRIALAIGG